MVAAALVRMAVAAMPAALRVELLALIPREEENPKHSIEKERITCVYIETGGERIHGL